MEEEAEAVLLGTIKVNSTVNDRCPYTSKAGGIPVNMIIKTCFVIVLNFNRRHGMKSKFRQKKLIV
jgi:hypothetical protein